MIFSALGCPIITWFSHQRWPYWARLKIWGVLKGPVYLDDSENSGFSHQIIHFNRVFHYKPSILGYPYFWKHPPGKTYVLIMMLNTGSFGGIKFKPPPIEFYIMSDSSHPILPVYVLRQLNPTNRMVYYAWVQLGHNVLHILPIPPNSGHKTRSGRWNHCHCDQSAWTRSNTPGHGEGAVVRCFFLQ